MPDVAHHSWTTADEGRCLSPRFGPTSCAPLKLENATLCANLCRATPNCTHASAIIRARHTHCYLRSGVPILLPIRCLTRVALARIPLIPTVVFPTIEPPPRVTYSNLSTRDSDARTGCSKVTTSAAAALNFNDTSSIDEDHHALVDSFRKYCMADALEKFPISSEVDQKLRALDGRYSQRRLGSQGNIARVRLQVGCYWALAFVAQVQRGLGQIVPFAPPAPPPARRAGGPRGKTSMAEHARDDKGASWFVSLLSHSFGPFAARKERSVDDNNGKHRARRLVLARANENHDSASLHLGRHPTSRATERVTRVCETGFNAGHSAVVLLSGLHSALATQAAGPGAASSASSSAPPRVEYRGFDLGDSEWTGPAATWINRSLFPGELHLILGDSSQTIPFALGTRRAGALGAVPRRRSHASAPPLLCDVISVDGNHTVGGVVSDWLALRHHVNPTYGSLVLFDDVDEVHPVWQQPGLRRIGCVTLSGIADDEPRRAVPMSASSGFCVAVGL